MKRTKIGDRFGTLVVIGDAEPVFVGKRHERRERVLCKCDCGNTKEILEVSLISGHSKSCGCKQLSLKDLTGKRFGRLTVVERDTPRLTPGGQSKTSWKCRCDCGSIVTVLSTNLIRGKQVSCGCYMSEVAKRTGKENIHRAIDATRKHGESRTRLYSIWCAIKSRVHNTNNKSYPIYGGRGIKICPEWDRDYSAFRAWALKNGYDKEAAYGVCTIDRIDVDGNYCPENCRFISQAEQNRNRRKRQKKQACS